MWAIVLSRHDRVVLCEKQSMSLCNESDSYETNVSTVVVYLNDHCAMWLAAVLLMKLALNFLSISIMRQYLLSKKFSGPYGYFNVEQWLNALWRKKVIEHCSTRKNVLNIFFVVLRPVLYLFVELSNLDVYFSKRINFVCRIIYSSALRHCFMCRCWKLICYIFSTHFLTEVFIILTCFCSFLFTLTAILLRPKSSMITTPKVSCLSLASPKANSCRRALEDIHCCETVYEMGSRCSDRVCGDTDKSHLREVWAAEECASLDSVLSGKQ